MFSKQNSKTILLWLVFILIFVSIWQIMANDPEEGKKVIFSDFQAVSQLGSVRLYLFRLCFEQYSLCRPQTLLVKLCFHFGCDSLLIEKTLFVVHLMLTPP